MKRRDFLQGVVTAGVVAIRPDNLFSATQSGQSSQSAHPPSFPYALAKGAATRELLRLENEHLSFKLSGDATARIVDRKTGAQWRMGPVALQEESEIDL